MTGELYILAPSRVVSKARDLYSHGLFKQALELLERNKVVFEVLPTEVKVSLPRPPAHNYTFKKGNRYGKPPERS